MPRLETGAGTRPMNRLTACAGLRCKLLLIAIPLIITIHLIASSMSDNPYSMFSGKDISELPLLNNVLPLLSNVNLTSPPPLDGQNQPLRDNIPVPKTNATLFMLARNSEIEGVVKSVRQVEDRFNKKFKYNWVFLNDEHFTDHFKKRVSILVSGTVQFGIIPSEHWEQPSWINETLAEQGRNSMRAAGVPYADSVSYRKMCRWNSGFFFHHPLMTKYRYYWRVEPDVHYWCNLDYDPFKFMEQNKKIYGFTMSLIEIPRTVPNLWNAVKEFQEKYPQHIHPNNTMAFLSDDKGKTYNHCHFWSNFEIADMDFYRSKAYTDFFEFLEAKGGFFYERWGDAPVHSIAVSLFAPKKDLHYFRDIGYKHDSFSHCPSDVEWASGKCSCPPGDSFNKKSHSCTWGWTNLVH